MKKQITPTNNGIAFGAVLFLIIICGAFWSFLFVLGKCTERPNYAAIEAHAKMEQIERNSLLQRFAARAATGNSSGTRKDIHPINSSNNAQIEEWRKSVWINDRSKQYNEMLIEATLLKDYYYPEKLFDAALKNTKLANALFDSAIDSIRQNPNVSKKGIAGLYFIKGSSYGESGDFVQASNHFALAMSYDPEVPEIYFSAGKVMSVLGNPVGAINFFDKLIILDPQSFDAWNSRGMENLDAGNFLFAIKDFTEALELQNKKDGVPRMVLQNKIGDEYSDNTLYFNRGKAYALQGDVETALIDFEQALKIKPKDANVLYHRGGVYYTAKKWDLAKVDFKRARELSIGDNDGWADLYLWQIDIRHGQRDEAFERLKRAFELLSLKNPQTGVFNIYQFVLDNKTEVEFLKAAVAQGDVQSAKCEAFYYIAFKRLLNNDLKGAAEYFAKSVETKDFGTLEYGWALAELKSDIPTLRDTEKNIFPRSILKSNE